VIRSIYLIRHGETEWSLSGQHTGRTDIGLTANGEAQARRLRPLLQGVDFAHVFTSPATRARQTCLLAGLSDAAQVEPDLVEWDYGEYEGKRSADIRLTMPDWNVFRDGAPGGETCDQIAERADHLIARLRRLNGNIALFSHGQFGPSLAARWIGLPVVEAAHLYLDTASLSVLGTNPHHPEISIIRSWNIVPPNA
jgi:probable phosphoglycerate mutase